MGRGFVKARHGILPLPPPAAVECLRGVPTYGVDLDVELVTPTGAAILATVASALRALADASPPSASASAPAHASSPIGRTCSAWCSARSRSSSPEPSSAASHVVLEANVDDLTGELAAHAIEALFAAGALDAWATPITMKKGRPALTIAALAPAPQADRGGGGAAAGDDHDRRAQDAGDRAPSARGG